MDLAIVQDPSSLTRYRRPCALQRRRCGRDDETTKRGGAASSGEIRRPPGIEFKPRTRSIPADHRWRRGLRPCALRSPRSARDDVDAGARADERAGGRCYADQCLGAAYVTDRPNDKNSSVVLTLAPWAVDWSCADLLDFGFVMNGGEGRAERGQGPLRGSWAGRDRDRVSWQRRGPWQAGVVFPKEHGDFLSTPSDLRGEDLKGTQPERRPGENDRLLRAGSNIFDENSSIVSASYPDECSLIVMQQQQTRGRRRL